MYKYRLNINILSQIEHKEWINWNLLETSTKYVVSCSLAPQPCKMDAPYSSEWLIVAYSSFVKVHLT